MTSCLFMAVVRVPQMSVNSLLPMARLNLEGFLCGYDIVLTGRVGVMRSALFYLDL